MKKFILILTSIMLILTAGCGSDSYTALEDDGKFDIVCTIYPIYNWVQELTAGNENVNVTFLLDNGIDLHNYQPTIADIAKIQNSDLFIYVGGDSDTWASDVVTKNMNSVNLIDKLGERVLDQEEIEGMQADDDHNHSHWWFFGHSHDDEHVWLSLLNATVIVEELSEVLGEIDTTNQELYTANAGVYVNQLNELEAEFRVAVENSPNNTLLFADRFPFRYLVDDYGIEYFAAFSGCASESTVSVETIKFLADKVDELSLDFISIIEGSNNDISTTVNENISGDKKDIIIFNSMQSITQSEVEAGITYLDLMAYNLEMLKIALGN